jgi:hypothetical protein
VSREYRASRVFKELTDSRDSKVSRGCKVL